MKPGRLKVGRLAAAAVGLGAVVLLLRHAGPHAVASTLVRAAPLFPFVLLCELLTLFCTMRALRTLYKADGCSVPRADIARAGLVGFAVMGLVPAGRTAAESTRAAMLSRYSTPARASVAAARMQAIALLANAAISVPSMLAVLWVLGVSVPAALVGLNFLCTFVVGLSILLAGRRSRLGTWLGRKFARIGDHGEAFDRHFASKPLVPWRALGWETLGRTVQVVQNGAMVVAVGGALGVLPAFCSEALHLAGAMVGDLIPAQLGATELNYRLSAQALSLGPADALSIALLAHLSQLFWVAVGSVVPALWPPAVPAGECS
jgi:hypothetical protein